jgi:HAD superfamily phosphoserine phosphatase-like hydrolase
MEKTVKPTATEPELFVFDICDTLFYSNTTFDFIKFVLQEKGWTGKIRQFKSFTRKSSPVFVGLYILQKFSKQDWPKKLCLRLLKGLSKEELFQFGEAFEKHFLTSRLVEKTHQMLNQLKKEGKQVVLISASIDPVVAAIAKALEVDFRCSELAYDKQGYFTGALKHEMTGQKRTAVRLMLSSEDALFAVATDNFSDRGLVEAACQRYVVVYNEKALNYWQDLKPEFIKLYS